MPVIPLVLSDCATLISSLPRLSAHHLALAASALQPLKSGTLSLQLSVPVPALIPSVVTWRPSGSQPLSSCASDSAFADHCACFWIIITHLLTYFRIIKDKSNVLFNLLPSKRDVQLTTGLRCARQYPTIYSRTNRYKNSFILFGLNHVHWCDFVYAWFFCMFV